MTRFMKRLLIFTLTFAIMFVFVLFFVFPKFTFILVIVMFVTGMVYAGVREVVEYYFRDEYE